MTKISTWVVQNGKPEKLQGSKIDLEKHLEDWIESDPTLIQGGLVIVYRQLILDGGRLDLLAIDPQGRWVVIELKAGTLDTGVITQSLFYVSQIARMSRRELSEKISPYLQKLGRNLDTLLEERGIGLNMQQDERETVAIVVGTSSTGGLNKLLDYLGNEFGFPISAVTFDVFETSAGEKILIRELTESDFFESASQMQKTPRWNLEYIREQAKKYGTDKEIDRILEVAGNFNLYIRSYAGSIMVAPLENKNRMLFTVWVKRNKDATLKTYIGSEVFSEFYDITEKDAINQLGSSGWRNMTSDDLDDFIMGLENLFRPRQ